MSLSDELKKADDKVKIKLRGEEVEFTNLDKVYYPKGKITISIHINFITTCNSCLVLGDDIICGG